MLRALFCLLAICILSHSCQNGTTTKIKIGIDPSWYPENFGSKTDNINVFLNALVQELDKKHHLSAQIVESDAINLYSDLGVHFQAAFTTVTPNPKTNDLFLFSDPVIKTGPVLIVRTQSPLHSLEDFSNHIIGVYAFSNEVLIAQKNPKIIIKDYVSAPLALEELVRGTIDGVLLSTLEAEDLVSSLFPGRLKIVSSPLSDAGIRLIIRKDSAEYIKHFLHEFNIDLEDLRKEGNYRKLRKKYFLNKN